MRAYFIALLTVALAVCGLVAGLLVAPAHAGGGTTLADLPSLGYSLDVVADLSQTPPCSNYYASGNGAPSTLIGDPSHDACQPAGAIQQRIDALLVAYPPLPQTTAAATTTGPVATTTVEAPPAVTTTADTTPAATTTTAPAATTFPVVADASAPAPTVTVTVSDPTVDAKIAELDAKLAALSTRVDAIAQANTASWDAFVAASNGGASAADSALAARSAGLNALYQLA